MSDPIRDILEGFESESKFTGNEAYDDLLSESVKKIRQQIGRELIDSFYKNWKEHFAKQAEKQVRKVCQLEVEEE